jgi:hypothetical protein
MEYGHPAYATGARDRERALIVGGGCFPAGFGKNGSASKRTTGQAIEYDAVNRVGRHDRRDSR